MAGGGGRCASNAATRWSIPPEASVSFMARSTATFEVPDSVTPTTTFSNMLQPLAQDPPLTVALGVGGEPRGGVRGRGGHQRNPGHMRQLLTDAARHVAAPQGASLNAQDNEVGLAAPGLGRDLGRQ